MTIKCERNGESDGSSTDARCQESVIQINGRVRYNPTIISRGRIFVGLKPSKPHADETPTPSSV